jgi:hypothetical protein
MGGYFMRVLLASLTLSFITVVAEAGVVVHYETKDLTSGKTRDDTVMYAQDGMLRMDSLDDQGHVTHTAIARDGVIWEIDVRQRTYMKIDKAVVQQRMGAATAQLQAMMAQMPPERRAVMEERMKQMQQPDGVVWNDTGRSEQAGAYRCRVYEEQRTDRKARAEYCLAAPGSVPGGEELAAAIHKAALTAQDIFTGVPQVRRRADQFSRFAKMNGVPVLKRELQGGKVSREEHARSIDRESLAADQFALPKGFTEKSDAGEN